MSVLYYGFDYIGFEFINMMKNELQSGCIEVIEKGCRYLINCIENNNFYDQWFGTSVSPPVEHSSSPMLCFFTAMALRNCGGIPETIKNKLITIISDCRKGDSYGYDKKAPADSDDTAFALRTLIILGSTVTSKMITEALRPFKCGNSWFTFPKQNINDVTPEFHYYYQGSSSAFGPHPEVHMNILLLHQEAGLDVSSIPGFQGNNGLPVSYFYRSDFYGAWLFGSLCKSMKLEYYPLMDAVLRLQNINGGWSAKKDGFSSVQETSLALLTLDTFGKINNEVLTSVAAYLVSQQSDNGLFPGGSLWHHYLPANQDIACWYANDVMSIVTTGLALLALNCILVRCGGEKF